MTTIAKKRTRNSKTTIIAIALITALTLLLLAGCSAPGGATNQTIVGSWTPANGTGSTMTFHDSGNCENVTYKGRTSDTGAGHYTKYELESDGTVFIIGDYWGDRAATIKKIDDRAKTANDYGYYCIEGDTLVWDKKVYKRA